MLISLAGRLAGNQGRRPKMTNHPSRSKKTAIFAYASSNGFGGPTGDVRARDFDHAAQIIAFRMTGIKSCAVRLRGLGSSRTATIFGDAGYNLGDVSIEAKE